MVREREAEFVKRAGFAIVASYGFANKHAGNEIFEAFLGIIERETNDDRIYVKKAVNWALRNIGKRNRDLRDSAIVVAHRILRLNNKSAE
ncbi:MAG: 3-methyladenine DNA glycosylase AlkD [Gammaproteobacteria bacterium]|jgi:3-methyladenine DNA glycosylase AlkD